MNYYQIQKIKSHLFIGLLYFSAAFVLAPLIMVVVFLFLKGASSLNLDFLLNLPRPVGEVGGGMRHAIIGTFYMVSLGSLIAVPLGIICGIFLAEYGEGKVPNILRMAADLLTGVPSIVIGIFAYTLIVVPFKSFSALAGGVALSMIILPIVIRSTEEILKLIPNHIREAGLALGLPRWKVIYFIIVKGNLPNIFTGVILAVSRAAGETAPLLFTAFGNMYMSYSLTGPMASLPVQIYNYAISPFEDWQRQAWAGAFVLIILVLGLNITSRIIVNRKNLFSKQASSK